MQATNGIFSVSDMITYVTYVRWSKQSWVSAHKRAKRILDVPMPWLSNITREGQRVSNAEINRGKDIQFNSRTKTITIDQWEFWVLFLTTIHRFWDCNRATPWSHLLMYNLMFVMDRTSVHFLEQSLRCQYVWKAVRQGGEIQPSTSSFPYGPSLTQLIHWLGYSTERRRASRNIIFFEVHINFPNSTAVIIELS